MSHQTVMAKTALGLASYGVGTEIEKDRSRRKAQVKRQRAYERKYYKAHKYGKH